MDAAPQAGGVAGREIHYAWPGATSPVRTPQKPPDVTCALVSFVPASISQNVTHVIASAPFASLDAATARRVAEGIGPWLAGRTVLMLVHHHDPDSPSPGMEHIPRVIEMATGTPWQAWGECVTM